MKIVYLPLDERPCNAIYPQQLAAMTDLKLTVPNMSILGNKKIPANITQVCDWLKQESVDTDYLVLSLDMLLYGGIVPSRIHELSSDELINRLNQLVAIKEQNKNLKIYAFTLIMRTPAYNSNDEEPDYYQTYGERLFRYGVLLDKKDSGHLTEAEEKDFVKLKKEIPSEVVKDYTTRRKTNEKANKHALELVKQGIIDYLVIPLDDNAEYGFSSIEKRSHIQQVVRDGLLDKVAIYPGADEVGCTLFAKVFCEIHQFTPSFFVRYSSTKGPYIIPKCEDRSLGESIKSQITTAGGKVVDHSIESDVVLMVHSPAVSQELIAEPVHMLHERHPSYFSEINYQEFIEAIEHYVGKGKVIGVADVALCNGSDVVLMNLLSDNRLLDEINAYAGWNTSGNSLGTVIAHAIIEAFYQNSNQLDVKNKSREFFYARLIEDWGYQAIVKTEMNKEIVAQNLGTYFDISENLTTIEQAIKEKLESFINRSLLTNKGEINLIEVYSPWRRMFEIGIEVSYRKG
ncbi:DUF4127 family protein [Bacillus sp. JJ1562]|uniref:DUF4127 family protein n=1 Tax=Bacillus sp. JJ1562 TaxID=3122960 RepID=UPI0030037294